MRQTETRSETERGTTFSEKIHWPNSAKPYTTPCGLKWNMVKPNGNVIQTKGAGNDPASFFSHRNRCDNCARMVKKW